MNPPEVDQAIREVGNVHVEQHGEITEIHVDNFGEVLDRAQDIRMENAEKKPRRRRRTKAEMLAEQAASCKHPKDLIGTSEDGRRYCTACGENVDVQTHSDEQFFVLGEAAGGLAALEAQLAGVGERLEDIFPRAFAQENPLERDQYGVDEYRPTIVPIVPIVRRHATSEHALCMPGAQIAQLDSVTTVIEYPLFDHECALCPLHARAKTVCVRGNGPENAEIMFVAQNPGKTEDRDGPPFIGPAGKLLDQMLAEANISRATVYITNAVKCATPEDRAPNKKEANSCSIYLASEIAKNRPNAIVAFGNTPLQTMTGSTGITKERGKIAEFDPKFRELLRARGVPDDYRPAIIPTLHPASALPGRSPQGYGTIVADLKLVLNHLQRSFNDIPVPWIWANEDQQIPWSLEASAIPQTIAAFDIETNGKPLYDPAFRIAMIAIDIGLDPVLVYRGANVREGIGFLANLAQGGATIVGQNAAAFDCAGIEERTGAQLRSEDTMLLAHLLDEQGPKGLQDLCVRKLGVRPWKDENTFTWEQLGRGELTAEKWQQAGTYNARDTRYTRLLYILQRAELNQDERLRNYYEKFFLPMAYALSRLERNGLHVSKTNLERVYGKFAVKRMVAEAQARVLVGNPDFNPGSSDQVREFLFGQGAGECGLPAQGWTKGGDETTSKLALLKTQHYLRAQENLSPQHEKALRFVDAILDYRNADKRIGTYLEPWGALAASSPVTGRVFSHYTLHTNVSRTACMDPNAQNLPRDETRSIVGAPKGYVLVAADFSQLELRNAAVLANEPRMKEAFRNGADLHRLLAAKMTGKLPENVTDEERSNAKQGNFGFLYGADEYTYEQIMLKDYDRIVPRSESTRVRNAFHGSWTELRAWYQHIWDETRATGIARSPSGRVRRLPAIFSDDEKERLEALRQAINFPDQELGLLIAGIGLIIAVHAGKKVVQFVHDDVKSEVVECDQIERHFHGGKFEELGGLHMRECLIEQEIAFYKAWEHQIPQLLHTHFGIVYDVPLVLDVNVKRGG